jgi:hypothetical protein
LIRAIAAVYPRIEGGPETWPRARRLDALIGDGSHLATDLEESVYLLSEVAAFRAEALNLSPLPLYERALEISGHIFGDAHPQTVACLENVATGLVNDPARGWPFAKRLLLIRKNIHGFYHPDISRSLEVLSLLLQSKADSEIRVSSRTAFA